MERIEELTEELKAARGDWKYSGDSDPGIMLLEVFSHLARIQQSFAEQIGETGFVRTAELLGMKPLTAEPARTCVSFESGADVRIGSGTRLLAGETVFETEEPVWVTANGIKSFGTTGRGEWELEFSKPLAAGREYCLYFELTDGISKKRTPIVDAKHFVPLSVLKWEYFRKCGAEEWRELAVLRDNTFHFLFSGMAVVAVPEEETAKDITRIRIRAVSYGYEREPEIVRIHLNCAVAVQKQTLAKRIRFTGAEFRENRMYLAEELAREGECDLYVAGGDGSGYYGAQDLDVDFLIKMQPDGRYRLGTSKREELLLRLKDIPDDGTALVAVLYNKDWRPGKILGSGTGMAGQSFAVADKGKVLLGSGTSVFVRREGRFEEWTPVGPWEAAAGNRSVFRVFESEGRIRFGDNQDGKTPSRGRDNLILTGAVQTEAENGNGREGRIDRFYRESAYPGVTVLQFLKAAGGRREETASGLKERMKQTGNHPECAVTAEDYERLAGNAQGLKLLRVTAVPGYAPGLVFSERFPENTAANTVTLVFEPAGGLTVSACMDAYAKNLIRHMEPYRLLTTRLFAEPVRYYELTVAGELFLKGEKRRVLKEAEASIREYLGRLNGGKPGGRLSHGEICGLLEGLAGVEAAEDIRFHAKGAGVKDRLGDILIVPNGRLCLKEARFTCSEVRGTGYA